MGGGGEGTREVFGFASVLIARFVCSTAGRPGHMRLDHHVRPEDRGGLHDAVHDAGHKHTVRETGEEEAATVLVLEPAVVQRVDVHGHGVPGRLAALVHVCQVKRGKRTKSADGYYKNCIRLRRGDDRARGQVSYIVHRVRVQLSTLRVARTHPLGSARTPQTRMVGMGYSITRDMTCLRSYYRRRMHIRHCITYGLHIIIIIVQV